MTTVSKFVPAGFLRISIVLGSHIRANMSGVDLRMTDDQVRMAALEVYDYSSGDRCSKRFSYFAEISLGLKEGDIVLCETQHGVCMGKVVEIPDADPRYTGSLKNVLQKLDLDYLWRNQLKEVHLRAVKSELAAMKQKFEERALFEMMAERMPEAKALLARLDELS